jgi:hypothetical protein
MLLSRVCFRYGAKGGITGGGGNVLPGVMARLHAAVRSGDYEGAMVFQREFNAVQDALYVMNEHTHTHTHTHTRTHTHTQPHTHIQHTHTYTHTHTRTHIPPPPSPPPPVDQVRAIQLKNVGDIQSVPCVAGSDCLGHDGR